MTTKIKKDFDAVKYMRQTRDKISRDIADMNYEQLKEYFTKRRPKERIIPNELTGRIYTKGDQGVL